MPRRLTEDEILYAHNTNKPLFYNVAVDGKPFLSAFKNDKSKAYFLRCLAIASERFPIDIVAYCIIENRAYFVAASYDRAYVSLERYFKVAKAIYTKFYNQFIEDCGRVFKDKLRYKKIEKEDVYKSIVTVHSQAYATGLATGFDDYKYNSYGKYAKDDSFATLKPLMAYQGENEVFNAIKAAHKVGPNRLPADFINIPKIETFNYNLERILLRNNCLKVKKLQPEQLEDIIIELGESGEYEFDYIVEKLLVKERHKYDFLVAVLAKLFIIHRFTFDTMKQKLSLKNGQGVLKNVDEYELVRDVMFKINDWKCYSYDYIMSGLGFIYPNFDFLIGVYVRAKIDKGYAYEFTTKKLGLHDRELINAVYDRLR